MAATLFFAAASERNLRPVLVAHDQELELGSFFNLEHSYSDGIGFIRRVPEVVVRNSRREEQKAMQVQAQSTATCNQQTTTKAPPSWARTIGNLPNALIGRVLSELPFVSDGTRGGLLAASCVSHAWNSRVTALFNEYHEHHCEAEKWRRGTATVYSISIPAPSYSDPQRTVCQRSLAFYTRVSVLHLHKLMSGSSLHDWAIVAAEAGDLNALNALLRHQSWTTERKEELLYTAAHCGRKQVIEIALLSGCCIGYHYTIFNAPTMH